MNQETKLKRFLLEGITYMKNDNSKTPFDSYLESFERIRKTLRPLSKTLSEMSCDTSALTGVAELMSSRIVEMWREYENIDMSKSMSEVLKAAYTPFEVSESYKQSMESFKEIGRQFSAIKLTEEYRRSLDSLQKNIAKSWMSVSAIDTARSIKNIQESMQIFTDNLRVEQISQLENIDYCKILSQTLEANGTFKDAVDAAYEFLQEEERIPENVGLETDFSSEQEIQDSINDQMNNPVGFQERVANWTEEKRKKYFIVVVLCNFIFNIFFVPSLQNLGLTVTTKIASNVKELPQKGAEVICQLKENFEATIIENTNYYYKVTFTDENGIQREGYVAKRNLKIIEEPETEEMEEATASSSNE